MNKRTFLKTSAGVGITSLISPASLLQAHAFSKDKNGLITTNRANEFTAVPLSYAADALEPHIDAKTMEIHHDKHYQGYTDNLNAAIQGTKFSQMSIEEILKNVEKNDTAIRNNAGGYYNHTLFWKWISPGSGKQPDGKLADALRSSFGSVDAFMKDFSNAASSVFGSGWAWLLADSDGKLSITSTPNQDCPLMRFAEVNGTPILGIDVWEHAYYLKYQNKRADYIDAFFQVINWGEVANSYNAI
ncbi:MAG: superoxide dismutase [Cyclobacteriaceae bacterium]